MERKQKLPETYKELLSRASDYTDTRLPDMEDVLENFQLNPSFSNLHSSLMYVVDYVQKKYLAVGPQCSNFLGYNTDYIKDAGPAFYTNLWHQNDFRIMNSRITQESMDILRRFPAEEYKNLLFSFNYRVKSKGGQFVKFNQRSAYIAAAPDGTPLAAVGLVSNITHLKPDNNIILNIEKVNNKKNFEDTTLLFHQTYFAEDKDSVLTDREIEILKWICEGQNSLQIATRLYISIHTVNNHRKNILLKTNAKNMIEVVAFGVRNNLL